MRSAARRARRRAHLYLLGPLLAAALAVVSCGQDVEVPLAEAQRLQEGGQFEASLPILRELLEKHPDLPKANLLLGTALLARGEETGAVFPLRRAMQSDEFAVEAGVLLARALAAAGNVEDAEQAASAVLEREPDNVQALGARANARMTQTRYDAAVEDIDRMLRITPDDGKLVLAKASALESAKHLDEARQTLERAEGLERAAGDLESAASACVRRAGIVTGAEPDLVRFGSDIDKCVAAYPTQVAALRALGDFAAASGKPKRAIDAWRAGIAQAPEALQLRVGLANQLFVAGEHDEAIAEARTAAEDSNSLDAWSGLAELLRRTNRLEEADAALKKAEELAADPEPIRYLRAELLVDRGLYDEADALAAQLSDPAHGAFVHGRVLFRTGDPAGAVDSFEKGFARWPGNAVARAEAGRAAEQIGDFDRALGHYRDSLRADATVTQAGMQGARLAYALGRYDDAVTLSTTYISKRFAKRGYEGPEPYRVAIRAADAAGMDEMVKSLLSTLSTEGDRGAALAERARIVTAKEGPAAAEKLFLDAQPLDLADPKNEDALRLLLHAKVAQGRAADGLSTLDRAAGKSDRAALRDMRGRLLLELGRPAEARAEFAKALALDPDFGPARAGLGVVDLGAGDSAKALAEFDAAASAKTPDPEAAYGAAQMFVAQGDSAEAEKRLRAFVQRSPDHLAASNDLAWLLAKRGAELDFALELAARAARPLQSPEFSDTLAFVELQKGDSKAAMETLAVALQKWPKDQMLLFRLGVARKAAGDRDGALQALRQALAGGTFAETKTVESEIANLEREKKP